MMMNLFSTFDPSTGIMSLNWISMILFLIIMPYKFWLKSNTAIIILMKIMMILSSEIANLMSKKSPLIMFMSVFMIISMNNITGLLPYIFTASSHLSFSLSMALPMWMSLMLFGWLMKTNKMFTHLLPTGTPKALMMFMVMIETISSMIRPGSLAVRLMANMVAGHLLMSLLGSNTLNSSMMLTMWLFIILVLFESAVAMIQSYVFMTLITMYHSEI